MILPSSRAAAAAAFATLALAPAARAWQPLSDHGSSLDQVGLARAADGTLSVATLSHPTDATANLDVHTVDAGGHPVGATSVVAGWANLTGPELLGPDEVVFAGQRTTDPADPYAAGRVVSATRSGDTWTVGAPSSALPGPAYAADRVAAARDANGTLFTLWGTADGLLAHAGTDPNTPNAVLQDGCCAYGAALDGGVAAWYTNTGEQGIRVRLPDGTVATAPGSSGAQTLPVDERVGLAQGHLAYGVGYPRYDRIAVWNLQDRAPSEFLRAPGAQHVELAPGPGGRLWVLWAQDGGLRAARSNPDVTRLGAVVKVRSALPIDRLAGDGQLGPLDAVATRGSAGAALTRVKPGLTIVRVKHRWRALDAGDPVAARIRVGRHRVTATAPGYTRAVRPL